MLAMILFLAATFQFSLSAPTKTSAGILRSDGTLVKTLWQDQLQGPGVITGTWDETDNTGAEVAEGSYVWKLLKNTSVYTNTQTVGNTGIPTNTHGHQFFYPEGVAADADGKFLVVPDFDEPHHSFHRMAPTTGHVEWESGETINANILKGVAREHDGPYAYVTAWQVQDGGLWVHTIYRVNVGDPELLHNFRKIPFTVAGERIVVYGPGTIPAPEDMPDQEHQGVPLISIACYDDKLFTTDSYAGRISFTTKLREIFYRLLLGSLWQRELQLISLTVQSGWVTSSAKYRLTTRLARFLARRRCRLGQMYVHFPIIAGVLAVADRNDWIKKFSISGTTLTETDSYGIPADPGHRDPEGVREIYGMAMNAAGEICFTDRLGNGGRSSNRREHGPCLAGDGAREHEQSDLSPGQPEPEDQQPSETSTTCRATRHGRFWEQAGRRDMIREAYFGLYEVGSPRAAADREVREQLLLLLPWWRRDRCLQDRAGGGWRFMVPTLELASVLGGRDPNPYGRRDEPVYAQENATCGVGTIPRETTRWTSLRRPRQGKSL